MAFMKLPLLFLLIFSVTASFGQLYISPSEYSDSYLYAKDRLVYVEKDIHLVENNSKETEASIYLRKSANLLQGTKESNKNKGNGKLSVFQKGTSNAFDYNYWSMPVLIDKEHAKISDYIYEPLSSTNSRNANLIGGTDGNSIPLNISNRWIYTFAGSTYSNWAYLGDEFDLLPGEGFTMKGVNGINQNEVEEEIINSGSAQTYDFRGLPNDGKITLPIKKEQTLLIGNPYPSLLNLDKFLTENTSTTGIAYFWDSRENGHSHYLADYEGGYGTYSAGTGIYIPPVFRRYSDGSETGDTGSQFDRSIIPIAQGFMVIGKNDGILQFNNSQRLHENKENSKAVFKSPVAELESFHLNVEIDEKYIQKLALVFSETSSADEDSALDARKMDENPEDISWWISEERFVINVRPKLEEELIPLKISLKNPAELKFSASDFKNFNPDRLFIYDAKDGLYFGVKTGYLKLNLQEGDYHDRFYVSFIEKLPETSTANIPEDNVSSKKPENVLLNTIDIFQNNLQQQLEVKILYDAKISSIQLYDLNGKQFFNQNFKIQEKEFNFPTSNLSNAVYIVKVNTSDHKELTKKIGVKN